MSRTGFAYDERFLCHFTGEKHPERPDRLRAVIAGMEEAGLHSRVRSIAPLRADDAVIGLNHSSAYIHRVHETCSAGATFIDTPDSAVCPDSAEIARLAAGAAVSACDAVMSGDVDNAFCAVRPPGHHARRERSAGFCLFNNVAIAARHLQRRHGVGRVMILDWDVHHGDGTQDSFFEDPTVLLCSLHEDPRFCYPGSGYASEVGRAAGRGFTLNVPMPPGATDGRYRQAFEEQVIPAARDFRPDFLLISDGLDAHADDPLAGIMLSDDAFVWMMRQAKALAAELCEGRLIALLEGGYDAGVLSRCVAAQIQVLLGDD